MRGGNSPIARNAASLLVGANKMARKIFGGECSRAAAGAAADGAWLLSPGGDGGERADGKIVGGVVWPYLGIYVSWTGRRFGVVQLAVCGAAAGRRVRKRGRPASGRRRGVGRRG